MDVSLTDRRRETRIDLRVPLKIRAMAEPFVGGARGRLHQFLAARLVPHDRLSIDFGCENQGVHARAARIDGAGSQRSALHRARGSRPVGPIVGQNGSGVAHRALRCRCCPRALGELIKPTHRTARSAAYRGL
jgi:hypothetical protein